MTNHRITLVVDEKTLETIRNCTGGLAASQLEQVGIILSTGVRSAEYGDGGHWQCRVDEITEADTIYVE